MWKYAVTDIQAVPDTECSQLFQFAGAVLWSQNKSQNKINQVSFELPPQSRRSLGEAASREAKSKQLERSQ